MFKRHYQVFQGRPVVKKEAEVSVLKDTKKEVLKEKKEKKVQIKETA